MNKVKILFPPQFEPFQPYLSLPYLKALLTQYNIESSYYDANIDFYLWLFKEQRNRLLENNNDRRNYLYKNIEKAIASIKSRDTDLIKYKWAINVIDGFLAEISPDGVSISLSGMGVGNRFSTTDIKNYLEEETNLFSSFFDSHIEKLFNNETTHYFFSLVVIDQLPASIEFAKKIKSINPKAIIVFGGAAIARFYKRLIDNPFVMSVVDILNRNEGYKAIPEIFSIDSEYKGHITPDFSEIEFDKYLSPDIVLPYLVAHGCKWGKCTFCSHHISYEGYRTSTIDDVIDDLKIMKSIYNIDYISFCDEYLTHQQLEELSSELLRYKIEIKWSTFTRAEPAFTKPEFTLKLYQSGARVLYFGFETVSQRLLKLMMKGNNSKLYIPILESCKSSNIAVRLDIMIGFPTETYEEVESTYNFIKDNRDIIDTPFSSYPVAIFELREDIPAMNQLVELKVKPLKLMRGDLDEQYDFIEENHKQIDKEYWREKLIQFFKKEMSAELIVPNNKTHQLVLKDYYDKGNIDLPITSIDDSISNKTCKIKEDVKVKCNGKYSLLSLSNGGCIEFNQSLNPLIEQLTKGISIRKSLNQEKNFKSETIYKLLNYLYRENYITVN